MELVIIHTSGELSPELAQFVKNLTDKNSIQPTIFRIKFIQTVNVILMLKIKKRKKNEDDEYKSSKDNNQSDEIIIKKDYTDLENLINEAIGDCQSVKDEIKEIINNSNNEIIKL